MAEESGVVALVSRLAESRVKSFTVYRVRLGAEAVRAIATAVTSEGCSVTHLRLEKCSIDDAGAEALAEALKGSKLVSVSLRRNLIQLAGILKLN